MLRPYECGRTEGHSTLCPYKGKDEDCFGINRLAMTHQGNQLAFCQ